MLLANVISAACPDFCILIYPHDFPLNVISNFVPFSTSLLTSTIPLKEPYLTHLKMENIRNNSSAKCFIKRPNLSWMSKINGNSIVSLAMETLN
jgi:hypothetical protein